MHMLYFIEDSIAVYMSQFQVESCSTRKYTYIFIFWPSTLPHHISIIAINRKLVVGIHSGLKMEK